MSTIKTTFIQHPSAESPSIELNADGTVALPLSDLEDLANVSATPTDGQALVYDAATSSWVAGDVSPDALDAAVITTGTLDTARISGSYTGITGTGALNAGSVTSGFGNINIGTSTFAGGGAHTQRVVLTASNASYSIPTAARKPGVKLTVVGGGGGGSGARTDNAGNGGASSVTGTGVSVTAAGGTGGVGSNTVSRNGAPGTAGFASGNGGQPGVHRADQEWGTSPGNGGVITVAYVNLTSLTTLNVTVGAGGTAPAGAFATGGVGGRGQVNIEF